MVLSELMVLAENQPEKDANPNRLIHVVQNQLLTRTIDWKKQKENDDEHRKGTHHDLWNEIREP